MVWSMKSKQLAIVLIKILGLAVCFYAINNFLSGIIFTFALQGGLTATIVSYAVGSGIQVLLGILIIAMSRKIAGWMFKNDED
jgi:hypothetical protein